MDFFKFFLHNSYAQFALNLTPFALLYLFLHEKLRYDYLGLLLFGFFTLLSIALVQTLLLFQNKKLYAYKELTKLLLITKKIEAELESYGASGKGVYEKAKSLKEYLPQEMLKEVFVIADARNRAMHGNPAIENAHQHIKNAKEILKILRSLSSTSYKLFYYISYLIVLLITLLGALYFLDRYTLGQSLLFSLLIFYANKIILIKLGVKNYTLFIIGAIATLIGFMYYKRGDFSLLQEVVSYVF